MFKRAVVIEVPEATSSSAYANAVEQLMPMMDSAKRSGGSAMQRAISAMLPVIAAAAPAMAAARSKGAGLMSSDAALEARERAVMMLAAAKGEPLTADKKRRWPMVMAFFALGGAMGAGITSWLRGTSDSPAPYTEVGHAGPKVDLSHPLTESDPQPVTVLDEDGEAASGSLPTSGSLSSDDFSGDYSDPKATF